MNKAAFHEQSETRPIARDVARRLDRPVMLVGMMGAGKSTVGRRLATALGLGFTDADDEIEAAAGMGVTDIFESYGEAHFRSGERRVIARLIDERHGVIATGGGAFVQSETRALILKRGIAVWIDCDVETLVERTARRDTRPLLRTGEPAETLRRLAREREPAYAEAPIRVAGTDRPHHATVDAIVEALDRWL